jgi:RNA polymerase sigma-70 factor (ECF subfamily)
MKESGAAISNELPVMIEAKKSAGIVARESQAESLFRRHGERLLFYLRGLVGDEHAAEDLLQDLFVSLIKSGALHKAESSGGAYLFCCARNAALNALDSAGRSRRASEGWKRWKSALLSTGCGQQDVLEADALTDALKILDEDAREIVLLHTHAGLSFSEIAEITGSPKSTVADRYAKALLLLKAQLARSGC